MPEQQSNEQQQGQQTETNAQPPQSETPASWDAWVGGLPEDQRATVTKLYEAQTQGLQSALRSERDQRKQYEQQLRQLQAKAEKGSEAEKQLTEMISQLEYANRRNAFVEEAVKPENAVYDMKAAWLVVTNEPDEYLDKKGNVNFALLKQRHPALFKQTPTPRAGAGNGTGQGGEGRVSMNDWIRSKARNG